ncbi:hypothetical protein, partial [Pseudonocardia nigra]|uniref:hypothetical protein n=1 Tax=Pseudonocardia nigra TaxID=1921578 RepID=UPI001FE5DB3C
MDEPHRDITETDLAEADTARAEATDRTAEPGADVHATDETVAPPPERVEVPDRDLREIAADEPAPVDEDTVRVPSAEETSDAIEKANRALVEMRARDAADAQEAEEHRAEELNRWHTDDHADETADVDEDT